MRATPRLVLTLALALALPATLPMLGPSATMQQAASRSGPSSCGHHRLEVDWHDGAVERRAVVRLPPRARRGRRAGRRQTRQGRSKDLTFDIGEIPTAGARVAEDAAVTAAALVRPLGVLRRFEVGRVHDLSVPREAQRLRRQRRPVQEERDGRQPRDRREEGIPEDPAVRVLGRGVDWIALQRRPARPPAARRRGPRCGGRRAAPARAAQRALHPNGRAAPT